MTPSADHHPAAALAVAIERSREALARGEAPGEALRSLFIDALARLIDEAMTPAHGDPAFQAMVLRHRSTVVREYASLSAHAERDRRQVRSAVNALAHPEKIQRRPAGELREALVRLHGAVGSGDWPRVAEAAAHLRELPGTQAEPALHQSLDRLLQGEPLARLRRLDALSTDSLVARYGALWSQQAPGDAQVEGAQQRGDAVEALAAEALRGLAHKMNAAEDGHGNGSNGERYRVATSLLVPSSIPGDAQRAKSEWDVALLRRVEHTAQWDLLFLIEAKASPDAATTDLPRLLRGLRRLAQANVDKVYPFASKEGTITLRGASLSALPTEEGDLARAVLYCCDGPAEHAPRLLNAASRMQLLSAEASLAFAAQREAGAQADAAVLEDVWRQLLSSPAFGAVRHQYTTLRTVRELMVHPADLADAVNAPATRPAARTAP